MAALVLRTFNIICCVKAKYVYLPIVDASAETPAPDGHAAGVRASTRGRAEIGRKADATRRPPPIEEEEASRARFEGAGDLDIHKAALCLEPRP